jgi:RNA polymerase sigma factor (sigma-70 family)
MAIETMGAALRQINRLFSEGVVAGLSDSQLLERFLTQADVEAFEVLVGRHGPMVLSVCRAILRDPHDAEDAFQATFLVLVKTSGNIRERDALAGWLHRIAHRVAHQANLAAARRRRHEREVGQMTVATLTNGPAAWDDLLPALHQEIARLPEKLRVAIVHCDLEGMTQAQAAEQLHLSRRTLQLRLAEGRLRLKRRLACRGVAPDGTALGVLLLREARTAVPLAWREATARAAVATVNRTVTVGGVSAAAQQLARDAFRGILLSQAKWASAALLAAGLIGWGASAALIAPAQAAPKGATALSAPAFRPPVYTVVSHPLPSTDDQAAKFRVHGRVLDPDGKPVVGAGVYARHYAEVQWLPIDPMAARQKGRVAVTDADGRFQFELDKAAGDAPFDGGPGWHKATIAATAPGFAPSWVEASDLLNAGELTLHLVRDDVPVRGRALDSQGRPVAGVVVRIRAIWEVKHGVNLDAMVASGAIDENWSQLGRYYGHPLGPAAPTWQADPAPLWPGGQNAWTTGTDGRFEVRGVGRDRIARLEFQGGGVANGTLDVMARAAKMPTKPRPARQSEMLMFGKEGAFIGVYPKGTQLVGATFDFIAGPTKPITGVVRLKGSGKPVERAIIHGADPATHTYATARTDAAGRYRLDGVPKGAFYQLRFNPRPGIDQFLAETVIVDDTEGLKPIERAIELPPGVIVTGRLVDKATGQVVQPAHLTYVKAPDNLSVGDAMGFTRRADASFAMTVPPGRGLIAVTAVASRNDDPYVRARLRASDKGKGIGATGDNETVRFPLNGHHAYQFIDPSSGVDSLAIEFELTRGHTRKGKLIDPAGKPVSGARSYGQTGRWGNVQTLDTDSFEVHGLERGDPRLILFAHRDLHLVGSVVLKDGEITSDKPLVVRMERAGSIKGRLVDEDGQPLSGAKLQAMTFDFDSVNLPPGPNALWPDSETLTADADGRFQVDGLKRDAKATISVTSAGARPNVRLSTGGVLKKLTAEPGQVRDLGDVKVTTATD